MHNLCLCILNALKHAVVTKISAVHYMGE